MRDSFPIAGLLDQLRYTLLFWLIAGSLFYLNFLVMSDLPGEQDLMCVIGGGLTFSNLLFAGLISAMAGLVFVGFVESAFVRRGGSLKGGSSSLAGLLAGGLTTFCTLCSLPVVSLFGLSVSLGFITDYAIEFKVVSVLLLATGLYLVNRDLKKDCLHCVW